MKRTLCSLLVSLLVATLPFGSVLADAPKSKNAKVTLVYQHELPNVSGKSIKCVLVEVTCDWPVLPPSCETGGKALRSGSC